MSREGLGGPMRRLDTAMLARVLEAVSGALAALGGGAALAYLLFVPVYRGTDCTTVPGQPVECEATYATLMNGRDPGTIGETAVVVVLLLGVAVAAVWHARTGRGVAQAVLGVMTGVLMLWTLCPWLMPGAYLLPSVGLALVACAASAGHGSTATAER